MSTQQVIRRIPIAPGAIIIAISAGCGRRVASQGTRLGTEIECLQGTHGFDFRDGSEERRTTNGQKRYLFQLLSSHKSSSTSASTGGDACYMTRLGSSLVHERRNQNKQADHPSSPQSKQ